MRTKDNNYRKCVQIFIQEACEWINFDYDMYLKTLKEVKEEPLLNQKMVLRERDCNELYVKQQFEITMTKKQCIEAFMF